jgi:hypothetical protein
LIRDASDCAYQDGMLFYALRFAIVQRIADTIRISRKVADQRHAHADSIQKKRIA